MKHIFFDFDGTIADTLPLAIQFGHEVAAEYGIKILTTEDFRRHSLREALDVMGLPFYKFPKFVTHFKSYLRANTRSAGIFPGILDLLKSLKQKGHPLYVVSSNSSENISAVLSGTGLAPYFNEIISDSSVFGKHHVLNRTFKRLQISKEQSVYVGDEVRDIEACQKISLPMVAVSWGWDDRERLSRAGSARIANTMEELSFLISPDWLTLLKKDETTLNISSNAKGSER